MHWYNSTEDWTSYAGHNLVPELHSWVSPKHGWHLHHKFLRRDTYGSPVLAGSTTDDGGGGTVALGVASASTFSTELDAGESAGGGGSCDARAIGISASDSAPAGRSTSGNEICANGGRSSQWATRVATGA